jgi:hypothetical protein
LVLWIATGSALVTVALNYPRILVALLAGLGGGVMFVIGVTAVDVVFAFMGLPAATHCGGDFHCGNTARWGSRKEASVSFVIGFVGGLVWFVRRRQR